MPARIPNAPETDVPTTVTALSTGDTVVLDVREPDEWAEGHIDGATHLPMSELATRAGELDPAMPVITVCHAGVRSLYVAEALINAGFADVRSLRGGMIAWEAAGEPVSR